MSRVPATIAALVRGKVFVNGRNSSVKPCRRGKLGRPSLAAATRKFSGSLSRYQPAEVCAKLTQGSHKLFFNRLAPENCVASHVLVMGYDSPISKLSKKVISVNKWLSVPQSKGQCFQRHLTRTRSISEGQRRKSRPRHRSYASGWFCLTQCTLKH